MKRKTINIFLALTALIAVPTVSCKKDQFGTLNQDPGALLVPVTSGLFTSVISNMAALSWDGAAPVNTPSTGATVTGIYAQYFSETQYTDVSVFQKQSKNWDDFFAANVFAPPNTNQFTQNGLLFDLQTIITFNTDADKKLKTSASGSNANQIATARILKAYIFGILTDMYGDMPYSKTLTGDNGVVAFTKQQDIYTDLFKELTEAVAQFDGGAPVVGDILFGGDADSWKKFANSVHALLALHLSKKDPTTGKAEFAKALAAGVIDSDVLLDFPGGNFNNPIYRYYNITKRFDYAVSQTMTDWLAANNDPRGQAGVYGSSTVGFPFGLSRNDAVDFANKHKNYAQVMKGQTKSVATDAFPVLLLGEMNLARAEAAQMGWTTEDVAALYSDGIKASWAFWKTQVPSDATYDRNLVFGDAAFTAYLASSSISLAVGDIPAKIATQEWVTHFPNGYRGWSDWRRTGYPALVGGPAAVTTGKAIPRRFAYGPNEYSTNPANVKAAASQYTVGGDADSQLARMWWDIQ